MQQNQKQSKKLTQTTAPRADPRAMAEQNSIIAKARNSKASSGMQPASQPPAPPVPPATQAPREQQEQEAAFVDHSDTEMMTVEEQAEARFRPFRDALTHSLESMRDMGTKMRLLQKDYTKLLRSTQKKGMKKTGGRKNEQSSDTQKKSMPGGFTKAYLLSDALCNFLGVPKGTCMSRPDVTRSIHSHILANGLQDPSNRRLINTDAKLDAVVAPGSGDGDNAKLSYFNLQKRINHNFSKLPDDTAQNEQSPPTPGGSIM